VRKQTIKAVEAGHFRQKQDNDNTISTKATAGTSRKSTPKKGTRFTKVEEEDNNEEEEEEGLPLPIYEESLRENGVISLNDGESSCMFVGDCVSEFGIGCVQVADVANAATTKGALFANAGEWKIKGRSDSCPIKSSRVVKTVSEDNAGSAVGTPAASMEKPAWMDNRKAKGLPRRSQAAIKKEMGTLRKAGVFEPLKKATKLTLSKNAVVVEPIKKACPTLNKKGPVLVNWPGERFTLTWWKCYLDSCASYHSVFMEEFLRDIREGKSTMEGSCNAGTVSANTKEWYGDFEVWLNKKGIAELLSIPMLEAAGYLVSTHNHDE